MSLYSLSISCTRKISNFLSAFCEGIYRIPLLYPRKLCKISEMIVCESVEFSSKHSFSLYPSLDPYRWAEWQTETEYTRYAWAGGTFLQLCCCVSFLVVAEIVLGDIYLPYQLCRCVFFLLRREIVFGCTGQFFGCDGKGFRCYFLTYHTSCAVVSVFWLRWEIVFGYSVSKKESYSVSLTA